MYVYNWHCENQAVKLTAAFLNCKYFVNRRHIKDHFKHLPLGFESINALSQLNCRIHKSAISQV